MAHSLVPPTPGPLFAAEELGVDVGTMMLGGVIVGAFTVTFGLIYAGWANRRWEIHPPEEEDGKTEPDPTKLPPLLWSLLPILIPVALIAWGSFSEADLWWADRNVALAIGAGFALVLLSRYPNNSSAPMQEAVGEAIMSGAAILLITAAGGAFGSTLRQTGVADLIQEMGSGAAKTWALPICFLITTLVRTAQGSATVAMITAAPIAKAFLEAGDLGFHPVYLALAVGCGSKPIPWLNDSGFWIITRMSGMKETETLKIVTPMMSLMGFVGLPVVMIGAVGLPVVMIGAWLWPMA
jgi:GntP family gluconate:H+ symporter